MPLFNDNNLTPAQLAAQQILQIANAQFQQLAQSGQRGFNLIWNNQQATPQEVIAALGNKAGAAFALAQLNIATINSASEIGGTTPPTVPSIPAGFVLSFNSDGTATVTQSSSSSSSSGN
jgi:hypothetical protein